MDSIRRGSLQTDITTTPGRQSNKPSGGFSLFVAEECPELALDKYSQKSYKKGVIRKRERNGATA